MLVIGTVPKPTDASGGAANGVTASVGTETDTLPWAEVFAFPPPQSVAA